MALFTGKYFKPSPRSWLASLRPKGKRSPGCRRQSINTGQRRHAAGAPLTPRCHNSIARSTATFTSSPSLSETPDPRSCSRKLSHKQHHTPFTQLQRMVRGRAIRRLSQVEEGRPKGLASSWMAAVAVQRVWRGLRGKRKLGQVSV